MLSSFTRIPVRREVRRELGGIELHLRLRREPLEDANLHEMFEPANTP